jgi:hypothetical protein
LGDDPFLIEAFLLLGRIEDQIHILILSLCGKGEFLLATGLEVIGEGDGNSGDEGTGIGINQRIRLANVVLEVELLQGNDGSKRLDFVAYDQLAVIDGSMELQLYLFIQAEL